MVIIRSYTTVKAAHIQLQTDYLITIVHNVIVRKYCSTGLLKVLELIVLAYFQCFVKGWACLFCVSFSCDNLHHNFKSSGRTRIRAHVKSTDM